MKHLIFALVVFFFSSAAFAFHCPADAKAIDAGLAKASLSSDMKSEIIKLRDKGMEQHGAGDHKGSVDTLSKAMRMLLNSME
jgi:hypothetical protein